MSETPKPGQVWRDRESGVEVTVRQIVGESATYVGEALVGSCPLVDWNLHFEREVRAMSDNTERDKLAAVISQAVGGWNPATAAITNVADAILAEFIPEHDREIAERAWREGQGAGTVAAINFTPLEPNPYSRRES
jgi:hypothetical protein